MSIFLSLWIVSCVKVIDIDLNESDPVPVIEAYIENDSFCYVRVTWTNSFFKNDSTKYIETAYVQLSNYQGTSEVLSYKGDGIYRGALIQGSIGDTYHLEVTINGSTYSAESTMPTLIPIDSISYDQKIYSTFIRGRVSRANNIYVHYTDPVLNRNYYALRIIHLDTLEQKPTFYEQNDELQSGLSSIISTGKFYGSGDSVIIELASIDPSTYLYFKTTKKALFNSLEPSINQASPANPTSNFSEGVLGYFGAWSKDQIKFIIPE